VNTSDCIDASLAEIKEIIDETGRSIQRDVILIWQLKLDLATQKSAVRQYMPMEVPLMHLEDE